MSSPLRVYVTLFLLWLVELAGYAGHQMLFLPHLSLIYLLWVSLVLGPPLGLKAGLFLGLLLDMAGTDPFGLNLVLYGMIGAGGGFLKDKIFPHSVFTGFLLVLAAYFFILSSSYFGARVTELEFEWQSFFRALLKSSLLATVMVAPLMFRLLPRREAKRGGSPYPIRRFPK